MFLSAKKRREINLNKWHKKIHKNNNCQKKIKQKFNIVWFEIEWTKK